MKILLISLLSLMLMSCANSNRPELAEQSISSNEWTNPNEGKSYERTKIERGSGYGMEVPFQSTR